MLDGVNIVIVNWNSGELLGNCLKSIAEHGGQRVERVVVIDNGSTDGSAEVDVTGLPLDIVRTGENLGFGKACNLGVRRGGARYVLFFNPDAELRAGALDQAIEFLEAPEGAGAGVCGIRLVDQHGHAHHHCARFPTWRSFLGSSLGLTRILKRWFPPIPLVEFDHLADRDVDHVMGAFYLMRRDLFERIGGFDERFFVYFEDLDLSYRVRQEGLRIAYRAGPTAYHKQGGTSENVKAHRLFYSLHANMIYAWKHLGRLERLVVVAITLAVEPVSRSLRAILRGSIEELVFTIRGFGMLYADLPRIIGQLGSIDRDRRAKA